MKYNEVQQAESPEILENKDVTISLNHPDMNRRKFVEMTAQPLLVSPFFQGMCLAEKIM